MAQYLNGQLLIDVSTLQDSAGCRTKAVLSRHLGAVSEEDNVDLMCGQAFHYALETYWLDWDQAKCLARFDDFYKEWGSKFPLPDHPKHYDNARRVLEAYMLRVPNSTSLPFKVLRTERGFAVQLCEGIFLYGRYDGIVSDGRFVYGEDHKTAGRIDKPWMGKWQWNSQILGYTFAGKALFGPRFLGMYVNGIEVKAMNTSSNKCKTHNVPYKQCAAAPEHITFHLTNPIVPTEQELATWQRWAIVKALEYKEQVERVLGFGDVDHVPMDGMFNDHCMAYRRKCSAYHWCRVGRPADGTMAFKQMPYMPWVPQGMGLEGPQGDVAAILGELG